VLAKHVHVGSIPAVCSNGALFRERHDLQNRGARFNSAARLECFRPRPGPASSKRRAARSTRAGSALSHSSSGRGRWILNPTTVGSIPPCDATSPPTVGSRSTKPAREVRLLLEIPSPLRRRTIAALRRLRTGFDSRRRGRWDGATVAHEFHTLGISRFNSDPSNADDPRRDARFISAATRGSSPLVSTGASSNGEDDGL
jgi:hypothetical protein